MTRGIIMTIALVACGAANAAAQMPRLPSQIYGPDPRYWAGLSLGYVDGTTVQDGQTDGRWSFGYSSQIRATFEKTIQRGISAGLGAGFSSAPLTYSNPSFSSQCGQSCPAKADITQITVFVNGGSRLGFHGLYNVEAGFTRFSNFRLRDSDVSLPPTNPGYDFTFGFGGGFGYGFSRTAEAYVGQMFDFVLHPQGTTTTSSAPRLLVFRFGARVGF